METQLQTQKPFDATATAIKITVLSGGEKRCVVRFPEDREWCERARKHRLIRRQVGGGASRLDSLDGERADADLFAAIRQDKDGDAFDEYEASEVIGTLEANEVVDVTREGAQYVITLESLGRRLTHAVKIPSKKDVAEFNKSSVDVTDSRGGRNIRVALEPARSLYDTVKVSADGYVNDIIPITHKTVVVAELIAAVDAATATVNSDFFG